MGGADLWENVKADLAADGVGQAQVRKLLAQDAHHCLPVAVHERPLRQAS